MRVGDEQRSFRRAASEYLARRRRNKFLVPVATGAVMAVVGALLTGGGKVAAMAAAAGGVFGTLMGRQRFPLDDLYEGGRSIWDPPEGKKWKTREVVVAARAVVSVKGEEGDDTSYLLFEIPDADWLFVDVQSLPGEWPTSLREIACAEVTLTALHPNGPALDIETSGDTIPFREDERRWSPKEERWRGSGYGIVPAADLPEWLAALTAG